MIEKLAASLGRNDEQPNIELAEELVRTKDRKGIAQIAKALHNGNAQIVSDAIKVLYEIAERDPSLVSDYTSDFISFLDSKNNRLVWGAMTALSRVASLNPAEIFNHVEKIISAYESGSVITIDTAITVFAEIAKADPVYEEKIFPLIIRHLASCRAKEVPQHAERAFVCITKRNEGEFTAVLNKRIGELSDSQKKRVDRILKLIKEERFTE